MESSVIVAGDDAPGETAALESNVVVVKPPKSDQVVLGAVTQAHDAALEEAAEPGTPGSARVGAHLGAVMDSERVALHRFACTDVGYVGWVWTVQLSRIPRSKVATVDDVLLLPGDGSLLAPAWVPYDERIRAGDLGVGDVLETSADDVRLVLSGAAFPAVEDTDDVDEALWWELGLGRSRVLSAWGRDDAAERWWESDAGPEAPIARAAPGACGDCGFFVGLNGGLGRVFGVCANELAPDDGRVVALSHGCGAHSEAVVETTSRWADQQPADDLEHVTTGDADAEAAPTTDLAGPVEPGVGAETAATSDEPAAATEDTDHS